MERMHPNVRPHSRNWSIVAVATLFLVVNAGGFLLARAAEDDVDQELQDLDHDATERAADSLTFNKEHLGTLFRLDAEETVLETGALASQGRDLDAQRVTDILDGELGDIDLTQGSVLELADRMTRIEDAMEVQNEIARKVSISAFESATFDEQTKKILDKMQEVSAERDGVTRQWLVDLHEADKASSMLNNLPPQ